jgi:hypothetical protein
MLATPQHASSEKLKTAEATFSALCQDLQGSLKARQQVFFDRLDGELGKNNNLN